MIDEISVLRFHEHIPDRELIRELFMSNVYEKVEDFLKLFSKFF